jgi:uncharacterized membrane protein
VALRFGQLPGRALFIDEAITQIRVAGHTIAEVNARSYDGRQHTAQALRAGAQVDAASSVSAMVASLIKEDAQHPPLFYAAELGVVRLFGDSLLAWRLLPAIFGVLCIPAAYALARELFPDRRAALLAAALVAVSPIGRIYSEQAREYSLMTLLTLITTWAVVRAARIPRWRWWALYGVVAAAGLYASPFIAYVLAAHGVFALAAMRRSGWTVFARWGTAVAAAVILYAPWLYEMAVHKNTIVTENVWSATRWPLSRLAAKWAFNTGSTFFDLEYLNLRWALVLAVVAVLAAIALWRGFRAADASARWALGTAIVVPAVLLVLPDVFLGEHRSAVARYALSIFIILPIAVARGLAGRPLPATILLAAGFCACLVSALHPTWWDNDSNGDDAQIAAAINREPASQLISGVAPAAFVPLARLLHDDVRVSLTPDVRAAGYTANDPIFAFNPAPADLRVLQRRTGSAFETVPYVRTVTAHDIGAQIAGGAGAPDDAGGFVLYRAVRSPLAGGAAGGKTEATSRFGSARQ